MAKAKHKIQQGDVVAVHWADHTGFRKVAIVPGSLTLTKLVTYGEVLSPVNSDGGIEIVQEREVESGGENNDACVIDIGAVKKIVGYRVAWEIDME